VKLPLAAVNQQQIGKRAPLVSQTPQTPRDRFHHHREIILPLDRLYLVSAISRLVGKPAPKLHHPRDGERFA